MYTKRMNGSFSKRIGSVRCYLGILIGCLALALLFTLNHLPFEVYLTVRTAIIRNATETQHRINSNQTVDGRENQAITYPSGVVRDSSNRFSFPGSWRFGALYTNNDHNACGPGTPRVYPFGAHGCCSDKRGSKAPNSSVFWWPDFYSDKDYLTEQQPTPIVSFLNATRGRTVLFVGDSLTLQMYAAIAMELTASSIPYKPVLTTQTVTQAQLFVAGHNVKMQLLEFYDVQDPNETTPSEAPRGSPYYLRESILKSHLQKADIVIANLGLHNWPRPTYQGRQMQHIQTFVELELQRRRQKQSNNTTTINSTSQPPLCLFWRRTLPQHFATTTGSGHYGDRFKNFTQVGCQPLPGAWKHPSDQEIEKVRFNRTTTTTAGNLEPFPLLDFTSILAGASEYHSLNRGDCSHYCYSPLIWGQILHLTAEAIRQVC